MDLSMLLSGATGLASGNPLAALSAIGGLFGSKPQPGHELPDQDAIAAGAGVTREQAGWVCADEAERTDQNFDDVCKKYAKDIPGFLARVPIYNSTHPQSIVKPTNYSSQYTAGQIGTKIPTAEDIYAAMYERGVFPGVAVASTGTATQSLGSALTNQDIKNIGTGILNGGIAGGQAAAMETAEGKAAKQNAINDYVKEYQLPIAAGVAAIIWLAVKAFKK